VYLWPLGRGRLYLLGFVFALLAAIPFFADAYLGDGITVANGGLSASHALFGQDCATCHTPFEEVTEAKCASCHEKFGSPMSLYGPDRHYLYHSADFDRSAASTLEGTCASCHQEHEGADARLTSVADASCQACHTFRSFDDGHPEFAFAVAGDPDKANLAFPHTLHVREVQADRELDDVEDACLICHTPQADGMSFEPVSFEGQCDDCHLRASTRTEWIPVRTASSVGVLTLDQIRREFTPSSLWAAYWDPNEFQIQGNEIRKRPVYHADPWVMENLTRIRAELYPGAELAQLLQTSADLPSGTDAGVHEEGVATLRAEIRALRGNPSEAVQEELAALTAILDEVGDRLKDPYASRDETQFLVRSSDAEGGALAQGADAGAYETVIDALTDECQSCHIVSQATIARVQTDQRTLVRSEFDHGAHVIHARCLDCHNTIPIRDFVFGEDDPAPELDRAGIFNLPTIASCQGCHNPRGAPDDCTSCHVYHPDTSQRSNLSRSHR